MPLNSRSLKQPAWRAMRSAAPSAILVTLVFILLSDVLPGVISLFVAPFTVEEMIYGQGAGTWASLFLDVVLMLFSTVLTFGFHAWALRVARGDEAGIGTLVDGFGMVGRVLWMEVLIALRIIGWSVLLGMAYVLTAVPFAMLGMMGGLIVVILLSVLLYAGLIYITLRYSLAPLLLYDYPEAGSAAAVRRSVAMMRGHLWQFVKLHLSFWKWYLADILIGFAAVMILLFPMLGELNPYAVGVDYDALIFQMEAVMNSTAAAFLILALSTPLHLFFSPYQRISVANFYRALSQEPVAPGFSGESF